jgi:UDP-N-acetylmuramoyl-L-alanyl-D-glutamate--2,6-diaminopimelate ligase
MEINKQILSLIQSQQVIGHLADLEGIAINSQLVQKNYLFAAIPGAVHNGHNYIDAAINNGASIIICEVLPATLNNKVAYIKVASSHFAIAQIAHLFYGSISEKVKIIGVTGTNGKTTVATLLYQLFTQLGYNCGLVSTVQNIIGTTKIEATHTTPDAISLQALFAKMYDAGCSHIFMEVSSHALHQHRVGGVQFAGAIFTNISQDHLDYHKTMDAYLQAKKMLFDGLPKNAFAVINIDDKRGAVMVQNSSATIINYSLKNPAQIKGKILENGLQGLNMQINNTEVHFKLIGEFNAYNILAVYGAALQLHSNSDEVLTACSILPGALGRFEVLPSPKQQLTAIIDYAHTPDALLNVLATIKRLNTQQNPVITVVGCGGNRDKTKRPLMAAAACEHSQLAIFTADNPRNEEVMDIINDMQDNLQSAHKRKCVVIPDRREAIKSAIMQAQNQSIVLVAGKGHETYQEIKGVKHHFDDKEIVEEMFLLFDR